ncbi:MAG: head-tail adaptor protein [Candidatus Anammoxibacter sp.]
MPKREIGHRRLRKISVGDMRERIVLQERSVAAPVFGSSSFTQDYDTGIERWAKVETQFSGRFFNGVELVDRPSHKFTIRFSSTITTETRIRYKSVLYRILQLDNLEMRDEYLILFAKIDGDDTKESNQ